MYYHASSNGEIKILEPRISEHGKPLIYFSRKRENVLVYLSNAVEKYCKENGFVYDGKYQKWGPYGFEEDGKLRLEEYYPNALKETYQGVSGYIYSVEDIKNINRDIPIPDVICGSEAVKIDSVEYIVDAYDEILKAEKDGLISILSYEDLSDKKNRWLEKTIKEEYENASDHPEYRFFLKAKFPCLFMEEAAG
ncbi:MAG: hypothetical protein IKS54_06885 [Erysipelotrichaceae bacterium]|nr:hypothetical protein [Erysipelotrichaceae bacterium]